MSVEFEKISVYSLEVLATTADNQKIIARARACSQTFKAKRCG